MNALPNWHRIPLRAIMLVTLAILAASFALEQRASAQTQPGPPTNVVVTGGDQQITVTWNPPSSDGGAPITLYLVQWRKASATSTTDSAQFTPTEVRRLVITDLDGDAIVNMDEYGVRIFVFNNVGSTSTDWIAVVPNEGPLTPPAAPLNVMVTPGINSLDVSWDASIVTGNNAPTNYKVDWNPGGDHDAGTTTSYTIPNLNAGTTYSVRIRAENTAGGAWSSSVSGVPVSGPQVTSVTVADIDNVGAEITITLANPAPATQQTVYFCIIPRLTGSCTGTAIQNRTTSSPHTSVVLTPNNLAPETEFEVRASPGPNDDQQRQIRQIHNPRSAF